MDDGTNEVIKLLTSGGVGVSCLGTLIWVLRFVITRVESAVKENTEAVRSLMAYFKRTNQYVSGGKDAE